MREGRIVSLDGLRGIAVLVVIAFHYINNQILDGSWLINKFGKPALLLKQITYFGWSGVDLFFILSGFLIGNILLKNKHSPSLFKTFYIRRFCRIIPVYYLLIIIFFILTKTAIYNTDASIFGNPIPLSGFLLFIQNFYMARYNHFGPQALTPSWSLCVEEQFYLIIPFLVYLTNRKYAWMLAVAGIVLAIVSRHLSTNFYQGYTLLPSRIDSPMMGFLLAWGHQHASFKEWIAKHLTWLWVSLAILILLCLLFYIKSDPGIYGHTLLGVIFGLVVMIALYSPAGIFTKVLAAPFLLEIGRLSYFIYLYHQIINGVLQLVLLKHLAPVLDNGKALAVTLAALIITYLLALFIIQVHRKTCNQL